MSSGVASATSSMEVPPAGEATITGPCDARSMRIEKYISRRIQTRSMRKTLATSMPLAPVCLVTSVSPSIFLAKSSACSGLVHMCTPPLKPFLNVPRPRPPVSACALITTSTPRPIVSYCFVRTTVAADLAESGLGLGRSVGRDALGRGDAEALHDLQRLELVQVETTHLRALTSRQRHELGVTQHTAEHDGDSLTCAGG
ncbi:hypothetical protein GQ600_1003 [Phytophthora cactorum]|nr:hypothetical protein GQ600_1003 [Phytophthora cactorum]